MAHQQQMTSFTETDNETITNNEIETQFKAKRKSMNVVQTQFENSKSTNKNESKNIFEQIRRESLSGTFF